MEGRGGGREEQTAEQEGDGATGAGASTARWRRRGCRGCGPVRAYAAGERVEKGRLPIVEGHIKEHGSVGALIPAIAPPSITATASTLPSQTAPLLGAGVAAGLAAP